jgi:hypothetical protein
MTNGEIKKELKKILEKIDDNTVRLWTSDLNDCLDSVITENYFDTVTDDDSDESNEVEVDYNGWLKDLKKLVKKIE